MTITTGKTTHIASDDDEVSDDGTEIAQALGLHPIVQLQRQALQGNDPEEIYFYASLHEPQDANFKQLSNHIQGPALLLTGSLGEIWYTRDAWNRSFHGRPGDLSSDLIRVDFSTSTLGEVRIRVGYVQVAIPYIGGRRRAEIIAITELPEMDPWRLRVAYDRPIPRRIAETAGVPREAFGQRKVGSVVSFVRPQFPKGSVLRGRYQKFLRQNHLRSASALLLRPLVHRVNTMLDNPSETRHPSVHYTFRAISKLARKEILPPRRVFWSDLRASLYCFAGERMRPRICGRIADDSTTPTNVERRPEHRVRPALTIFYTYPRNRLIRPPNPGRPPASGGRQHPGREAAHCLPLPPPAVPLIP